MNSYHRQPSKLVKFFLIAVAAIAVVYLITFTVELFSDPFGSDGDTSDSYNSGYSQNSSILSSDKNSTAQSSEESSTVQSSEENSAAQSSEESSTVQSSEESSTVQSFEPPESSIPEVSQLHFRNGNLLEQHYQKHGIDMGFDSADEYEKAAAAVPFNPEALHKTEAEDGDDVYYIERTNEFVIVSTDGYLRTYFNPDRGKDYFDRQ